MNSERWWRRRLLGFVFFSPRLFAYPYISFNQEEAEAVDTAADTTARAAAAASNREEAEATGGAKATARVIVAKVKVATAAAAEATEALLNTK